MKRAELIKNLTTFADVPISEGEQFIEILLRRVSNVYAPEKIFEIPEIGTFSYKDAYQGNIAFTIATETDEINFYLPVESSLINPSIYSLSTGKPTYPLSNRQSTLTLLHNPADYISILESKAERMVDLMLEVEEVQDNDPINDPSTLIDDNIFDELTDSTLDDINELSFNESEAVTSSMQSDEELFSKLLEDDLAEPELEEGITDDIQEDIFVEEKKIDSDNLPNDIVDEAVSSITDEADVLEFTQAEEEITEVFSEPELTIEDFISEDENNTEEVLPELTQSFIEDTEPKEINELREESKENQHQVWEESLEIKQNLLEEESSEILNPELREENADDEITRLLGEDNTNDEINDGPSEQKDFLEIAEPGSEIPVISDEVTSISSDALEDINDLAEILGQNKSSVTDEETIVKPEHKELDIFTEGDIDFDLSDYTTDIEDEEEDSKLSRLLQEFEDDAALTSIPESRSTDETPESDSGNESLNVEKELSFLEIADKYLETAEPEETVDNNLLKPAAGEPEDTQLKSVNTDVSENYQRVKSLTREFFSMSEAEQKKKILTWDFGESEQLDKEIKAITRSFDEPVTGPDKSKEGFTIVQGKKATMEWTPGTLPDLAEAIDTPEEDLVEEINLQLAEKHIPEETVTETFKVIRKEQKRSPRFIIIAGIVLLIGLAVLAYFKLTSNGIVPVTPKETTPVIIERNDRVPVLIQGESENTETNTPAFEQKVTPPAGEEIKSLKVKEGIYQKGNAFYIQVSSWQTKSKAYGEADRYQVLGYVTEIQTSLLNSGTWYRLLVGEFNSIEEAEAFLNKNL